ncbi:MAG TPA: 23S rRNA (uracil(1939)-C(5))-methyltransferase RlmD [Steroidobacteraceae bacterium]|nr:23S rRNA (uracil(1939)-C(5))-methyltransferase RlmD [Steroidobacteraceae bacterium]
MNGAPGAAESLEVTSLSHDGRGVAHRAGKALFIAGALPGERVSVRNVRRRRSFDEGEVDAVITPSPERAVPRCPHFGVCGGCSLQHLDPAAQLRLKQEHLLEELRRTGRVEPEELLPPLSAAVWQYRRRARLGARFVPRKEKVVVGFRERSAPLVADLRSCEVLAPPFGALIAPLSELLSALSIRSRVPQVEIAAADNANALVFRVLDPPTAEDLQRLRAFGERHDVEIYLQSGGVDSVSALSSETPLYYRLDEGALEIEFRPTDFIQVNGALNRSMVAQALRLLEVSAHHRVLDLFCGLGNFTLPVARRAAEVVGIEGDAALVGRARTNAARNGIHNAEFHAANLDAIDPDLPWARRSYDRVLLDPPRVGARGALSLAAGSGVQRVVYISCHPGSLARDAGILVHELGLNLKAVGVMDMFPHTSHVESVAVFGR